MKTQDSLLNQEVPIIVANVILGIGTTYLPTQLAQTAGPDGVIALLIAIFIALAATVLVVCLVMRFPNQGIADYSTHLVGRVFGFIFNIGIMLHFLIAAAVVLRLFSDTVNIFLLPRTPLEVVMITMLIPAAILTRNGLQPIARVCQIVFFTFFFSLIIIPFTIPIFDSSEFLPLFQNDFSTIASASFKAIVALAGVEILLIVGSHTKDKRNFMKLCFGSVLFACIVSSIIVVLVFGSLSVEQTAKLNDPLFEMIKYLPVPILLLERIDILFFAITIASAYTTQIILLYGTSHHLAETFKLESGKGFVLPLSIGIFYLARIPANQLELRSYSTITVITWLGIVFGIVPLFLLLSYIRNKGRPLLKSNPNKKTKITAKRSKKTNPRIK